MPKLKSVEDLTRVRQSAQERLEMRTRTGTQVIIGMATCGIAAGAGETKNAILEELQKHEIDATVTSVGCIGICSKEPLVDIEQAGCPRISYCNVHPDMVPRLIEEHLIEGNVVQEWVMGRVFSQGIGERLTYEEPVAHQAIPFYSELPFYRKQKRITLRNCGIIDPENIEEFFARDGYAALAKVLTEMVSEDVIDEVKRSGLRGRGGAGFLTGLKWGFTSRAPGDVKYLVCNADEGDPGAFMDRATIEGDPHSLLEGMTICGYAVGAKVGYIYCRAEYPLAIRRLRVAIAAAEEHGLLGDNILGSDFSFRLHIKEGAGAFVCGEETALLASIEGRRGEPRPRPPFPAERGLWDKPTNLNNVKSYANVPQIILNGADWFAGIGTERSTGTAIFALTGKVNNTGLVEVPMGITLREIIYDIGGGIPDGKQFKAVQTGGPLGGCLPADQLDVPVDFDSLVELGAVMGSGGMIVVDEDTCMVELSKFFLTFATAESCGKCVPCRMGGKRMLEALTRITEGEGKLEDLKIISEIAAGMENGALCALGQLTPGPVVAALRYFEDEFLAHVVDHRCPSLQCAALVSYYILPDQCEGCGICLRACPAGAILGGKRMIHVVDQSKCIKCGNCFDVCPSRFSAVLKVSGESVQVPEKPIPVGEWSA